MNSIDTTRLMLVLSLFGHHD